MQKQLNLLRDSFQTELAKTSSAQELEDLRLKYLSKKNGLTTKLLQKLPSMSASDKKKYGPLLNALKAEQEQMIKAKASQLTSKSSPTTLDLTIGDGIAGIEIEERDGDEVTSVTVCTREHGVVRGAIVGHDARASNPAFDVTPPELITGLITERGIVAPERSAITALFADRNDHG